MPLLPAALSALPLPAPNDLAEVAIPIVAIVGGLTIPIVALTLAHKKKVLQARIIERAIEQGLTVEEIDELLERQGMNDEDEKKPGSKRAVPFRAGLIVFAVGVAFFLVENPGSLSGPFGASPHEGFMGPVGSLVAYLLMGIGLALVASDVLALVFGPARRAAERDED